jgi:hypothetical protein
MHKPLIQGILLSLVFLSSACGNAKFNGKGKKDKKQADQVVVVEQPINCKPGETCVVVNPDNCKVGEQNCPVKPTKPTDPGTGESAVDDCKDGRKACSHPSYPDCDQPGQNPSQNPGQNPGSSYDKSCYDQDDTHQNAPTQNK